MSESDKDQARRCALQRAAEALQGEVTERCKRLDRCAEWESMTWRYRVPEPAKAEKVKGRCVCAEHESFFAGLSSR